MEVARYKAWAYLPVDPEPTTGEPSFFRPPMLTALAIDPGASLVIEFPKPAGVVEIAVETTALSGEGRGPRPFRTFSGSAAGAYSPLTCDEWSKSMEGMYATFTSRARGVDRFLKLNYAEGVPLVVNGVSFKQ